MDSITFLVRADAEGGFMAHALGASIFSQAKSLADLRVQIRDAVFCHFESDDQPRMIRLRHVEDFDA